MMKCPDHMHTADYAGTNYSIQFGADSDIELEFNLTVTGPPGWEYYLDRYNVVVPPWALDGVFITLTVIPPPDAMCDEIGVVTVIARDASQPSIKTQVSTHTIVSFCYWLSLSPDKNEDFVDPGKSTSIKIMVSNYGNMAGKINVSLSLNQSSPSWNVSIDRDSVAVAGGESVMVYLTVTAPADATAGSRLTVRVKGSTAESRLTAECMLMAIVTRVQKFSITGMPEAVELRPGESAACDFSLINTGNGVEYLRPAFPELPEGWSVSLLWENGSPVNTSGWRTMGPGITAGFRARFAAPSACLRGDYAIPGELQFKDGPSVPYTVNATVSQLFDIRLSTADSAVTCAPGSKAHFDIICQNLGNGHDDVTFGLSGLPDGWPRPQFSLQGKETGPVIGLEPFGQELVSVDVEIPPDTTCRTLELTVTVDSAGGISDSINVKVNIRLPNLAISTIRYSPASVKTGREGPVTITVENTGEVAAENILVRFWDGKKVLCNEYLARLPPESSHTVTFFWKPHNPSTLKFMVDPDDQIQESNENDNLMRESIGGCTGTMDDSQPYLIPAVISIALLWIAFLILLRVRRI